MTRVLFAVVAIVIAALFSLGAIASTDGAEAMKAGQQMLPGLSDPRAIFCLIVFFLSYTLVIAEEQTHLRKSKPVMLGAGIGTHFLING